VTRRTARTTVFDNGDGTSTALVGGDDMNWKDRGAMAGDRLAIVEGGWRAAPQRVGAGAGRGCRGERHE
jgi:hypothetical protein